MMRIKNIKFDLNRILGANPLSFAARPIGSGTAFSLTFGCLLLLCASPGATFEAQKGPLTQHVNTQIDKMKRASTSAYIEIRNHLATDDDVLAELRQQRTDTQTTKYNWNRQLWVQRVLDQQAHPEATVSLDAVKGVHPGTYLHRRHPIPEVARELKRLRLPPTVLIERFLRKAGAHPFALDAEYPSAFSMPERKALRKQEESAMNEGILFALGSYHEDFVQFFLLSVIEDQMESQTNKQIAMISLGRMQSAPAFSLLKNVATNDSLEGDYRVAAIVALGHYPTKEALVTLDTLLNSKEDIDLNRASLRALGRVGTMLNRLSKSTGSAIEQTALKHAAGRVLMGHVAWLAGSELETATIETIVLLRSNWLDAHMSKIMEEKSLSPATRLLVQKAQQHTMRYRERKERAIR
jgi:hypothetical protein